MNLTPIEHWTFPVFMPAGQPVARSKGVTPRAMRAAAVAHRYYSNLS